MYLSWEAVEKQYCKDPTCAVVDVRTPEEYRLEHLPNAINIPLEEISQGRPILLPDLQQMVIVYCQSGRRSRLATALLKSMGYQNVLDLGGLNGKEHSVVEK